MNVHRPRAVRWIILAAGIVLAFLLFLLLARQVQGQSPPTPDQGPRHFDETGFSVSSRFLEFFDSHGGLEVFGYPISAPFIDEGIPVQCFQKVRMEWHTAGDSNTGEVRLGSLGEELGFQTPGVEEPVRSTRRRVYYPETGHSVSYFFLRYLQSHGDVALFGHPITEMYVENQKVVQYFQHMKLVWDPQTMRVTVGDLGELYVRTHQDSFPPNALTRPDLRHAGSEQQALSAALGVAHTVVGSNHVQSVAVAVLDRNTNLPVPDAKVRLTLHPESGDAPVQWEHVADTDAQGRTSTTIPLKGFRPGTMMVLTAEVNYGLVSLEEKVLFLVWW